MHVSWTIKKAQCQRIDAFELCCWRRLLRIPWTAKRSNQSILKEINPEYLLEGLMAKLKLQYFGRMIRRADSLEKSLMLERLRAGGEGNDIGWDVDGVTDSMDVSLSKLREIVKDREAWRAAVHRVTKSWTQLSNWTTTVIAALLYQEATPCDGKLAIIRTPIWWPTVLTHQGRGFPGMQDLCDKNKKVSNKPGWAGHPICVWPSQVNSSWSSLCLHQILFPFLCYGMHPLRWLQGSPSSASHDFCNYIL